MLFEKYTKRHLLEIFLPKIPWCDEERCGWEPGAGGPRVGAGAHELWKSCRDITPTPVGFAFEIVELS